MHIFFSNTPFYLLDPKVEPLGKREAVEINPDDEISIIKQNVNRLLSLDFEEEESKVGGKEFSIVIPHVYRKERYILRMISSFFQNLDSLHNIKNIHLYDCDENNHKDTEILESITKGIIKIHYKDFNLESNKVPSDIRENSYISLLYKQMIDEFMSLKIGKKDETMYILFMEDDACLLVNFNQIVTIVKKLEVQKKSWFFLKLFYYPEMLHWLTEFEYDLYAILFLAFTFSILHLVIIFALKKSIKVNLGLDFRWKTYIIFGVLLFFLGGFCVVVIGKFNMQYKIFPHQLFEGLSREFYGFTSNVALVFPKRTLSNIENIEKEIIEIYTNSRTKEGLDILFGKYIEKHPEENIYLFRPNIFEHIGSKSTRVKKYYR